MKTYDLRPTRAVEVEEEVIELAPGETSLSFLQRVYRCVTQPMSRRMQAAMAALPHEHPKLGAVATLTMNSNDFASLLDRAVERSSSARDFKPIGYVSMREPESTAQRDGEQS
jgi:hypothetical protein